MTSGRFPLPQDLNTPPELAEAVLSAVMNGCLTREMPDLQPEHFTSDCDKVVWQTLVEMEAEGITGEFTNLVERLKRTKHPGLGDVDWLDYCEGILRAPEHSSSLAYVHNAKMLIQYWGKRQEYAEAQEAAVRAADLSIPWAPPGGWKCDGVRGKRRWTSDELLAAQFPEPHGPWPGVIPAGLTVLASRPKSGKSLLMLQLVVAIGGGGLMFGQKLEQMKVLYYGLEDNGKRLQERLALIGALPGALIEVQQDLRALHLGGLAQIKAEARNHQVIVIDTLERAMPGLDLTRDAKVFAETLGRLQAIALEYGIAIIIVVHTRKKSDREPDPIEDVMGSTQLITAADCVLAIYPQKDRALLKGRARDIADIELTMHFNTETKMWDLLGQTEEIHRTEKEAKILEALRELGKARASAVAQELNEERSNTSARPKKLVERGLVAVETVDRVPYYSVAEGTPEPQPSLLP